MPPTIARYAAAVFLASSLTACGGSDEGDPVERFIERRDAGASCAELFDIRNDLDPHDDLIPTINEGLRNIGCYSATSDRTD